MTDSGNNKNNSSIQNHSDNPRLPISLIARILSYNIVNTKDVAALRLLLPVSKSRDDGGNDEGNDGDCGEGGLVPLLPAFLTTTKVAAAGGGSQQQQQHIACPTRVSRSEDLYIVQLCGADEYDYEEYWVTPGETLDLEGNLILVQLLEEGVEGKPMKLTLVGDCRKIGGQNGGDDGGDDGGGGERQRKHNGENEGEEEDTDEKWQSSSSSSSSRKKTKICEEDRCRMMATLLKDISIAKTSGEIKTVYRRVMEENIHVPVDFKHKRLSKKTFDDPYFFCYPTVMTLKVQPTSSSITKTLRVVVDEKDNDEVLFLHLKTYDSEEKESLFSVLNGGMTYRAMVTEGADLLLSSSSKEKMNDETNEVKKNPQPQKQSQKEDEDDEEEFDEEREYVTVKLFIELVAHYDDFCDYDDVLPRQPIVFRQVFDTFQKNLYVEGVAIVDDPVSPSFARRLNSLVNVLATEQDTRELTDYHPHSNDVVRDLVHPALYPYVRDVTPLRARVEDVPPCTFAATAPAPSSSSSSSMTTNTGNESESEKDRDFWDRPYETSKYQWLPTYVTISHDGQTCTFDDYINNLVPRRDHADLYGALETLLVQALPYLESVYSYVRAIRPKFRTTRFEASWHYDDLPKLDMEPVSLRGRKLQVIPKIVDYELGPDQTYEGVWHVEGMSHEEIVMTCLYILDRDDGDDGGLEGGALEFKRALLADEAGKLLASMPQTRHDELDELARSGLIPLGTVETPKGRLIVFPNSHVHRVGPLRNTATTSATTEAGSSSTTRSSPSKRRRRIVVFFVVNPLKRIVSTREVAPQQEHVTDTAAVGAAGGTARMTLTEAKKHRLELMKERKHHKQDWNVREVELCEH